MGGLLRKSSILFLPLFYFALFLRLFKWISILCAFMHRSLNPLKVYGMWAVKRSSKLLRHMHTNSSWVNFCRYLKLSPLHGLMKTVMLSSSCCLVSTNSGTRTRLWVLHNCLRKFCSSTCQLTMEPSRRFGTTYRPLLLVTARRAPIIVHLEQLVDHLWWARTWICNESGAGF